MAVSDADWPASGYAITAAREQLRDWGARSARVLVAPHGDVDGLAAAAIVIRLLERLGATPVVSLPGKGEHVHSPAMQTRLAAAGADGLVVLDMGTRAGPIVEGLPTIVIDHHDAHDVPEGVIFVSGAGHEPVAPTGLLAYLVTRELAAIDDLRWLAVLATVGDLGMQHPFGAELGAIDVRKTHVQKTVSLINAARRAPEYKPDLALGVLLAASGPHEIARGTVAGVEQLETCRRAVHEEVTRVARVAPKVVDGVALIRFSSPAQIHPLIATRWAGRLAPKIVIAANDGYLPDRVNFAMRSASNVDLLAFLRGLGLGAVEGEFANGHPRATGGSVPRHEFERLLHALGY
jgi:single-stranded DNA-specific DHH superfamily exonuclease